MNKITSKPKKWLKYPKILKIIEISPKPKNDEDTPKPKKLLKYPWNLKITKIPPKPRKLPK